MSSNNYVGQLRQQVAALPSFDSPPEKLRMFIGGEPDCFAIVQHTGQPSTMCESAGHLELLNELRVLLQAMCGH